MRRLLDTGTLIGRDEHFYLIDLAGLNHRGRVNREECSLRIGLPLMLPLFTERDQKTAFVEFIEGC